VKVLNYMTRKIYYLNLPLISHPTQRMKWSYWMTCIWQVFWDENQKVCEGYPHHSNTLKLFGRYLGPLEKLPFLRTSVLRFFIFLNAFVLNTIASLSNSGRSRHMISISLVPCEYKYTQDFTYLEKFTYYKEENNYD